MTNYLFLLENARNTGKIAIKKAIKEKVSPCARELVTLIAPKVLLLTNILAILLLSSVTTLDM